MTLHHLFRTLCFRNRSDEVSNFYQRQAGREREHWPMTLLFLGRGMEAKMEGLPRMGKIPEACLLLAIGNSYLFAAFWFGDGIYVRLGLNLTSSRLERANIDILWCSREEKPSD